MSTVRRINRAQTLRQRIGDALDVAWIEVNVGIALWVHVALGAVDTCRDFDSANEIRRQEIARITGPNFGVSCTAQ